MAKALADSVALFVHTDPGKKRPAAQAKIETPNRPTAIETFVLRMSDRATSTPPVPGVEYDG